MDIQVLNDTKELPSKQEWSNFETFRLLLEPRSHVLTTLLRVLSAAVLFNYVPFVLAAVWVILNFSTGYWMRYSIVTYNALLNTTPKPEVVTPQMAVIVRNYKRAWLVNGLVWSCLSYLSHSWLPLTGRLACLVILNVLLLFSISRTYVSRPLMHQISIILLSSQFVFLIIRLINDTNFEIPSESILYSVYLVLMGYLLWTVGNRFNRIHLEHLDSEYEKIQLIETLNQHKAQLQLEQRALVASNNLVQQFYSGAAHDLRQPVYAMQLYASMLSDDPNLSKTLLPKITQSCISINDMFNSLFDYQQTHMNDTDVLEKEINLHDVYKSLVLHFHPIANEKGLKIRFKFINGTITMVPLYLSRILSNLISNALRYTQTGGVLVAVRKRRDHISFEIWDTGIGIEKSTIKLIFNEFYKVSKLDVNNDGLGLGLAIVKQLSMRIPKTNISVKSRVGRGSVFTFTVPLERYKAK